MNVRTLLGVVLVVAGILALVYQGIPYTSSEQLVELGPLEVRSEEEKRIPIPPLAGGALLAVGAVLVVLGRRRR